MARRHEARCWREGEGEGQGCHPPHDEVPAPTGRAPGTAPVTAREVPRQSVSVPRDLFGVTTFLVHLSRGALKRRATLTAIVAGSAGRDERSAGLGAPTCGFSVRRSRARRQRAPRTGGDAEPGHGARRHHGRCLRRSRPAAQSRSVRRRRARQTEDCGPAAARPPSALRCACVLHGRRDCCRADRPPSRHRRYPSGTRRSHSAG